MEKTSVKILTKKVDEIQPIINILQKGFYVHNTSPVIYDQNTGIFHQFVALEGKEQS
jgi:hypothetical protein